MFKQIVLPILGVAAFIVAVGLLVQKNSSINSPQPSVGSIVTINNKKISVEIANTEEKRKTGLSGRDTLTNNSGMLFVFDKKDTTPNFWMKDMKIAIDIIWINDDKIVKIDKNVPIPIGGTLDNKLPIYSPGTPIDYVLEVNSGFSDLNNINVGDMADLTAL